MQSRGRIARPNAVRRNRNMLFRRNTRSRAAWVRRDSHRRAQSEKALQAAKSPPKTEANPRRTAPAPQTVRPARGCPVQAGGVSLGLAPLRDGTGSAATIKRILKRDAPRPLNIHGAAPAPSKRRNRFAAGALEKICQSGRRGARHSKRAGRLGDGPQRRWPRATEPSSTQAQYARPEEIQGFLGTLDHLARLQASLKPAVGKFAMTSFGESREPAVARHRSSPRVRARRMPKKLAIRGRAYKSRWGGSAGTEGAGCRTPQTRGVTPRRTDRPSAGASK